MRFKIEIRKNEGLKNYIYVDCEDGCSEYDIADLILSRISDHFNDHIEFRKSVFFPLSIKAVESKRGRKIKNSKVYMFRKLRMYYTGKNEAEIEYCWDQGYRG